MKWRKNKTSGAIQEKNKFSNAAGLTGGISANVDNLALGAVDLVLVRRRQLSFDHDGVLGPGLQRPDQVTRVLRLLAVIGGPGRSVHVGNQPAVGAARVLPVELSHVRVRPAGDIMMWSEMRKQTIPAVSLKSQTKQTFNMSAWLNCNFNTWLVLTPLCKEPWSLASLCSPAARRAPTSTWSCCRRSWSWWTSAVWSHLLDE